MSILINILAFILTLGILITFHEWGHFIVARKLGVKVLRFSIGFGKPIWRRIGKDGTEYCIAYLPLGGYVKMLDEREAEVRPDDLPYAFNRKSVWARIAIVLAGPMANFIFAILAFTIVYSIGIRDFAPIINDVTTGSIAEQIGIKAHDEITAVNDLQTGNPQMVRRAFLAEDHPQNYVFTLKHDDHVRTVTLPANAIPPSALEENFFQDLGISFGIPAWIGLIEPNSPAQLAGLKTHDHILAINHQPITSWPEFVTQIASHPNEALTLSVLRDNQPLEISITPKSKTHQEKTIGYIGVGIDDQLFRLNRAPITSAMVEALNDTWFYTALTFKSIFKMLIGQMGLEHLSGPISIAVYAGDTVQIGLVYFLQFLALISISLGVINLLPIPMLDGGHLLYYVVEVIMRKPLSQKMQQIGLSIGLVLLVSLMALAFYNDVIQLSSG